jgi:porin
LTHAKPVHGYSQKQETKKEIRMKSTLTRKKTSIWLLSSVGMTALSLALANPVSAQTATDQTNSSVNLNLSPVQQFAQAAADDGITFNSRYNGEFAANPSGGERQGADFTGELNLGATADLDKMVGLQGGTINVLFTARAGNDLASKAINNSVSVQQIYGGGQTYQLTIFTYDQKLFNDAVDVTVGRTDIFDSFVTSNLYCDFQSNAVCGNPSYLGQVGGIESSYYPVAVWGGLVQFNVTKNVYLKTGLYQGVPNPTPVAGHGFNWGGPTDGAQGAAEVGYADTAPGAAQPNQYDAGIVVSRTHFSAPYYNSENPEQFGQNFVYAQAQKLLYQPVANAPQGLYAFAVGEVGTQGSKQSSNYSVEAGAVYQGIIPSRPLDYAGLVVNELHYNNRFLDYHYGQRLAEGGTQRPSPNLIMMELNYTAQVNPWLNFTPNIQYIVNPDGLGGLAYPTSNLHNALVLGLQFQIDVARLFGLTPPPAPPALPGVPTAAPAAAPAPAPAQTYLVFFDWDRTNLTPRAVDIIGNAAAASRSQTVTTINVSGYTDTSGSPVYNQRLSVRRAQAVEAQLMSDGVPASEIEIHGYGATHLLVPTGPGVREPQNRRVEIVLH